MIRKLMIVASYGVVFVLGLGLGIYLLPILTAPPSIDAAELEARAEAAIFQGEFTRDLAGSDFAHWGEGKITLSETEIVHMGRLSPGPDYKLYLVPEFVEDEAGFEALKTQSVQVGDIKNFDGFILTLPAEIDASQFTTVVVWCEAFGEFITAAKYR